MTGHIAQVLDAVDALTPDMVGLIGEVVRIPSVSGTDADGLGTFATLRRG